MSEPTKRLSLLSHFSYEAVTDGRTALISAAVTGKIDVRHWQPASPTDTAAHDGKIVIREGS